jgi:hypothetical protein
MGDPFPGSFFLGSLFSLVPFCSYFFELRQGASMARFCCMVRWSVGWLLENNGETFQTGAYYALVLVD